MNAILATLKKSGRAAIVAATIGAASVAALPAMAQSAPSFNFSLGLGGGGNSFSFGLESDTDRGWRRGDRRRFVQVCLTDRQIINGLRDHGYRDVELTRELRGDRVEVEARYGRSWYVLEVDRCTGSVQVIERVRPLLPGRPGFGLHFNFGN